MDCIMFMLKTEPEILIPLLSVYNPGSVNLKREDESGWWALHMSMDTHLGRGIALIRQSEEPMTQECLITMLLNTISV